MKETEIIEKIVEALESTKSAHKRLDKLEDLAEAIYSLTSDVKVLTEQLINLKAGFEEVKCANNKPNKVIDTISTVVTSSITVALISLILK